MISSHQTILIVDDHPLFREGLRAIITRDGKFKVAGEAGSAREALSLAKRLKPDLVIVDLSLPDQSGIELTRDLRQKLPHCRILIVSMHSKIDYIVEAFKAGATGYVVKESAAERLIDGLETIFGGEYFLDSCVSQEVVKRLMQMPAKDAKIADSSYGSLTPREQEVMRLLAEGISVKKIAEKLFISPKTVENHRANIMNKLDIHSTIELIRYAARLGLIDLELWR